MGVALFFEISTFSKEKQGYSTLDELLADVNINEKDFYSISIIIQKNLLELSKLNVKKLPHHVHCDRRSWTVLEHKHCDSSFFYDVIIHDQKIKSQPKSVFYGDSKIIKNKAILMNWEFSSSHHIVRLSRYVTGYYSEAIQKTIFETYSDAKNKNIYKKLHPNIIGVDWGSQWKFYQDLKDEECFQIAICPWFGDDLSEFLNIPKKQRNLFSLVLNSYIFFLEEEFRKSKNNILGHQVFYDVKLENICIVKNRKTLTPAFYLTAIDHGTSRTATFIHKDGIKKILNPNKDILCESLQPNLRIFGHIVSMLEILLRIISNHIIHNQFKNECDILFDCLYIGAIEKKYFETNRTLDLFVDDISHFIQEQFLLIKNILNVSNNHHALAIFNHFIENIFWNGWHGQICNDEDILAELKKLEIFIQRPDVLLVARLGAEI